MPKPILSLQPSEAVLVQSAATIFAAYVAAGKVADGKEGEWVRRSVQLAFEMAKLTDEAIQSDTELA